MIETLFTLMLCHLVGDYVLQIDYIAKTKGSNIYHLIVHCLLYIVPFVVCFGYTWHLMVIVGTHFVIDILKARFKKINYATDQTLHYLVLLIYLV